MTDAAPGSTAETLRKVDTTQSNQEIKNCVRVFVPASRKSFLLSGFNSNTAIMLSCDLDTQGALHKTFVESQRK
jgi:hypothetical protein